MGDETDKILFSCADCGSSDFIFPNDPPKDDDIVRCAGCNREIGRYDVIRRATTDAAKAEIDKLAVKTIGKKPTWRS